MYQLNHKYFNEFLNNVKCIKCLNTRTTWLVEDGRGKGKGEPETDADMSDTLQKDGCGDTIPPQYIIGTC